ncbi:MAG: GTPase Era [Actinobacteria bacterium]|nr:GTPase Era [Actinomycetota bacterium]
MSFRSGFVAVVGRPNVGKSTLVNALVGEKVSITSNRPQTTRSAVRGILDLLDAQMVFIDTPGYHKPRTLLGQRLNEVVRRAWAEVDIALLVVDARAGVGTGDARVAQDLAAAETPVFCAVNKIDTARRAGTAAALTAATQLGRFEEFIPTSGRTGEGVELLSKLLADRLEEGPMYYPLGTRRDQPPPVFIAELVREKLLKRTSEELPHSIAVSTEELIERDDGVLEIYSLVLVERESQKGMVIGKGGSLLKEAGTEARLEIEVLFGRRVYLDIKVKVERDWQRRAHALDRLGFGS